MAKKRSEPKTIQDALPLLQQLIRDGEFVWAEAQWCFSTHAGRATTSVEYSVFAMVHDRLASSDASYKLRVKADTPAKLVRAFAAELQKPRSRELVFSGPVASGPITSEATSPARPATPRLTQQRPLLTWGGATA